MNFDLNGKAVRNLRLSTVNRNNTVKTICAQEGDSNSRYFSVTLFDDRGDISLSQYHEAKLNATLPDGSKQRSVGQIDKINNLVLLKLSSSMLKQIGKVSCDISLVGKDINDESVYLTSQTFYVCVSLSQTGENAINGKDEPPFVEKILSDVNTIQSDIEHLKKNLGNNSLSVSNEKRITNIEQGYSDDTFETISGENSITVPSNSLPYAEISKVYGAAERLYSYRIEKKQVPVTDGGTIPDIDFPYIKDNAYDSNFADKITIEKLADGSFKINGYTDDGTWRPWINLSRIPFWEGSYGGTGGKLQYAVLYYEILSPEHASGDGIQVIFGTGIEMTTTPTKYNLGTGGEIMIGIHKENEVIDLIIKLYAMEVDEDYSVGDAIYVTEIIKTPVDTLTIPEEVKSLEGYGEGRNYVDFENGVFMRTDTWESTDIREHIGYDNFIGVVPNGAIELNGTANVTFMKKG